MNTNAPSTSHHRKTGDEEGVHSVSVWDLPLRVFHWAMVGSVAVAGMTGFFAPEWWLGLHVQAGYILGGLLTFRLVWGVVGSRYSRFLSFPLSPGAVKSYLCSLARGKPSAVIGHNPSGAWMIIVLLLTLTALTVSGLMTLGGQEDLGPLAATMTYRIGVDAAAVHRMVAWILVVAVSFHLLGVLVETRIFRHPVLSAMLIGKKTLSRLSTDPLQKLIAARGGVWFVAICVMLVGAGVSLATIPSPAWRAIEIPSAYATECGDCHHAYHPILRTKNAWRAIMDQLEDHYGEDASLDMETAEQIRAHLSANHAGTFDTDVAQSIGRHETPSHRITDTPSWVARHQDIAPSTFRLKATGSKINCNACHTDAATGRFDDTEIHLPEGEKS